MIENLNWSEPNEMGVRFADPTNEFWTEWRADKATLRNRGIRVSPGANGWGVRFEPESVVAPAVAPNFVAAISEVKLELAPRGEFEILDTLTNWSAEQVSIFRYFHEETGNRVVRARAGTGKTTTIKAAFAYAPEDAILYAVFNKKNQKEAAAKITDKRVEVKTLHSLGFAYIKSIWRSAKPDGFVERDRVLAVTSQYLPDEIRDVLEKLVSAVKNACINPSVDDIVAVATDRMIDCPNFEAPADGGWTVAKLAATALKAVELSRVRDSRNRISFDDMVWLPVAMGWVRAWYSLVCIDEAQDMNALQLAMARKACKTGGRVVVVGDDRQAIYGFRGAVQNGLNMMKSELHAEELGLTITYRCPKAVVALAQKYVPDYRAADAAPEGIIDSIAYDNIIKHAQVGDAILSRANAPLMPICLNLIRNGIAARIEGRDIGKMLLTIIRKFKAKSVADFMVKVQRWEDKQITRVSKLKNAEQKMEVIQDQAACLLAMAEGAVSVTDVENRCTELFEDSDNNPKPSVVLSSVHKAKGLEWNRVFIIRETFLRKGRESQEEENIYYVAITRAKQTLVFVGDRHPDEGTPK